MLNVTVRGKELELAYDFRRAGDELLFFVHGLGCSKEAFHDCWEQEALKRYSLLAFDLPGFGDSSKPENFSYSLEDHAAVCQEVLQQFAEYRVHFVANSMGPLIGLLLPDSVLSRFGSFVNVEGRLLGEDCGNSRKATYYPFEEFLETSYEELKEEVASESRSAYRLDKALPEAYYQGAQSVVAWADAGVLLDKYLNLSCPSIFIYGEDNRDLAVLDGLKDAETIQIPESGHFLMLDNPKAFAQAVDSFIARITN